MSIEESYNEWANHYDSNPNKTRDLDLLISKKTLSRYDFKKVIELGAGTGKNTPLILEKADHVICIDFSKNMQNKAKEKLQDKRIEFIHADINNDWPIENAFADLITCNLILEHIENLEFIFKEATQKLKPGGLFFISELHPFKQYTGSKAKFETAQGTHELKSHTHHISEFLNAAEINDLELVELKEWFDQEKEAELPRMISFVFMK